MEMTKALALEMLRSAVVEKSGKDPSEVQTGTRTENGAEHIYISVKVAKNAWQNIKADELLNGIRNGKVTLEKATDFIVELSTSEYQKREEEIARLIDFDKDKVLANVRVELLNRELNPMALTDIHFLFLDLIGRFYVLDEKTGMRIRITQKLADFMGIEKKEMMEAARKNLQSEIYVRPLEEVMRELSEEAEEDLEPGDKYLCVVSNTRLNLGASAMLCGELFEDIATGARDDLWIIPSSKYEVLVAPKSAMPFTVVSQMLKEVNEEEVMPEDFLSNTLYEYRRGAKVVTIAA